MGEVRRPGAVRDTQGGFRPLSGRSPSPEPPADSSGVVSSGGTGPVVAGPKSRDSYRAFARWYDTILEPMNHGLRLIGLRMFAPKSGMAVLDVGCGTGAQLQLYQRFGCVLFGIDSSPSMLRVAKAKLGEAADLRVGNAVDLPYATGQFDLVISMLCLHEMNPRVRAEALKSMKRVLRQDGRMLLIDHHPGPVQPLQGWITKAFVVFAEAAAGREHFRNYRQFMESNGLPALADSCSMIPAKTRVVGGGALALMLLQKGA
jgi:ubiquinone/menaquinone biosynthesis C-methylase UbiE